VSAAVRAMFPEPDPADVAAADGAVRAVLRTQCGDAVPQLVVVRSVAGAGKTTLLVELARRLVGDAQERVAIAANTDVQSYLLVRRLLAADVDVVLFVTDRKVVPDFPHGPGMLHVSRSENDLRSVLVDAAAREGAGLRSQFAIVANTTKWRSVPGQDLRYRRSMRPVAPVLLCDEAYQTSDAVAEDVLTVGERRVAVGDPGQIDPPTVSDTSEWAHHPDGPHRPFPDAALARIDPWSPGLVVLDLPYTRRNPDDGLPYISVFYDQDVRSLVPAAARRLVVDPAGARVPVDDAVDATAAGESVTGVLLPAQPTGAGADPGMARAIAQTAQRLLERHARVLVDPRDGFRQLEPADIMVIATHHDQLADLLPLLPAGVRSGTADSLQGEDAPIVLAWHPLSGAAEPDTFHCDAGRTCVMLTRHTVGVLTFSRAGVAEMLDDQHPSDLLVPGNPTDSARRAWRSQRLLFDRLSTAGRLRAIPEP